MEAEDKSLSVVMTMVFTLVMIGFVLQMIPAQPAPTTYTCPICGVVFGTYDELYQHFITAHPSTPIDIIWE